MADSDAPDGPPAFEDPFEGDDVEQRVYGVMLRTREPTTANAVADDADCDPKTARKYLEWFARLGVVTRRDGRPTTYERNDAYFEWRRVDRLAAEHSVEELQRRVRDLTETVDAYEREYGAATPDDVDALDAAEDRDDATVDDVYADLGDWATARRERREYERARRRRARSSDRGPVSG